MPDFEFSDADFAAMSHPEGMPGQMNAIFGDRGTKTVLDNTSALSTYYRSLANRSDMVAASFAAFVVWGTLALIPVLVLLWRLAV